MRIVFCPIDPRFKSSEIVEFLQRVQPKNAVIPGAYYRLNKKSIRKYTQGVIRTYEEDVIDIPLDVSFLKCQISSDLARTVQMRKVITLTLTLTLTYV